MLLPPKKWAKICRKAKQIIAFCNNHTFSFKINKVLHY